MAYNFDNATSEYAYEALPVVINTPLALVCMFKSDDDALDNQYPMALDDTGSSDMFSIGVNTSGGSPDGIRGVMYNAAFYTAETTVDWVQDTWHSAVALFVDDTDRRIFINGGNKVTNAVDSGAAEDMDRLVIGAMFGALGNQYMSGAVAEVALYDLSDWPGATASDKADNFERIIPSLSKNYSPAFWQLGLKSYVPLVADLKDLVTGITLSVNSTPNVTAHPPMIYPEHTQILSKAGGAPPATNSQVIMINMSKIVVPLMWLQQGKVTRRQFNRNTIASILGS